MTFLSAAISFDVSKTRDALDFLDLLLAAFAVICFIHVPLSRHGFLISRGLKTVASIDVIFGSMVLRQLKHSSTVESKHHKTPE
jgi:hypothetical protein